MFSVLPKTRSLYFVVLTTLLTFGLPTIGSARIILTEQTVYYDVTGSTGKEIFKSMLDKGPKIDGRVGHFLATTDINYDIKNYHLVLDGNNRCRAKDFTLVVNAKYTYPRWRGSRSANSTTRAAWNHFRSETVWHEKQHVKIAMDIARDMEQVLTDTKGRGSANCRDITWKLGFKARQLGSRHGRKQKQFDRRDLRPGGRGYKAQLRLLKAE